MIVPVVLSGGSGTRLWPLSRKLYPKQFINLVNDTSLFQDTIMRLPNNASNPLIICNEEHRYIVAEQLRQIKSPNMGIILEPIGKNTAPAIALAAMHSLNIKKDPILLVLSTDHIIYDNNEFLKTYTIASKIAEKGKIVALGVKPNKPEVGYGYIKVGNSEKNGAYSIISFIEKPNLKDAQKYYVSGKYFWNSGIFMFKASTYLKELEKYEPEIFSICKKSFKEKNTDLEFIRLDNKEFYKCPDISIDYAVMEKTDAGVVVPLESGWSDIGSWDSLWHSKSKDGNNNVRDGDVLLNKVKNSYIHSTSRLISVNDLSEIVIIDTEDALLVSSKKGSQNIKNIVSKLKNRSELDNHRKVYRSWGYYDSLVFGECFQVKYIFINSGSSLSFSRHNKRAKYWFVVKGIAIISQGKKVFELRKNKSTYIPKKTIHKIENNKNKPLEIIEIQTGNYLDEDDFSRL